MVAPRYLVFFVCSTNMPRGLVVFQIKNRGEKNQSFHLLKNSAENKCLLFFLTCQK